MRHWQKMTLRMYGSWWPVRRLLAVHRLAAWLCTGALASSACSDGGEPLAPADAAFPDAETSSEPDAGDASSPQDASVTTDAAPDAGPIQTAGGDRCLEGNCSQPALPEQPDYGFLSDAGEGWTRLIEAVWALGPKSEGYRCASKTMPEDVYIAAFKPVNPLGAHHTTLHVQAGGAAPDGVTVCGVGAGGTRRLQGSGVGSEPLELPSGVAMKVAAGEQLTVNLHLFNTSPEVLRGTSGVWIKRVAKADVMQEAEVVLAGPLNLSIPPGPATQKGSCTLRSAVTLYSVNPHMHQLGRHMKVTAHSSLTGDHVLFDGAYDFTHQLSYKVPEIKLAANDKVEIECTYMNDTTRIVSWGDSTLDEMCFAGLGLYPSFGAGGFPCTN